MQTVNLQSRAHAEQNTGQFKQIIATASLTANELVTHVNNSAAAVVVTLPPVAEAAGKIYSIYTIGAGGGTGVDVIAAGDALYNITEVDPSAGTTIDLGSAVAIDTAGDFLCLYSTGISWIVLAHRIQ